MPEHITEELVHLCVLREDAHRQWIAGGRKPDQKWFYQEYQDTINRILATGRLPPRKE